MILHEDIPAESTQHTPYVTALGTYHGAGANGGVKDPRMKCYGTRSLGTQARTKEHRDMLEFCAVYISEDEEYDEDFL